MDPSASRRTRSRRERGSEEFTRVLTFSDGVFAIAMTLLVVGIAVPSLSDSGSASELFGTLDDLASSFVSFFLSFAVIGRYWVAHHAFFGLLRAIDRRLMAINLVYLAFIAFLPFPTALLGTYFDNPASVVIYAGTVAIVSSLEVVLFRSAVRGGLFERAIPSDVVRWGTIVSLTPVVFFVASVPIAFVSTTVAVCGWLLTVPAHFVTNRSKPAGADELLSS